MVAAPETKSLDSSVNAAMDAPVEVKLVTDPAEIKRLTEKGEAKLSQSKKDFLRSQYQEAANAAADACNSISKIHGDSHLVMCDYHYNYGKCLLEVSRLEDDVLGQALTGVPDGDSELDSSQVEDPDKLSAEEKEKVAEQVDDALDSIAEKPKSSPQKDSEKASDNDAAKTSPEKKDDAKTSPEKKDAEKTSPEKESKSEESKAEEKAESKDSDVEEMETDDKADDVEDGEDTEETEEESQDESQEEESPEGDAEGLSSLQLAFEVLELAAAIYRKEEEQTKELQLKLSQVCLKLGEVCLENEQYEESVKSFEECLTLQKKHLDDDDRLLAETHYQLSVAQTFASKFDDAITNVGDAKDVITRLVERKEKIASDKGLEITEDIDSVAEAVDRKLLSEIRELKKLVPEMTDKILDIKESKKAMEDKLNEIKSELKSAFLSGSKLDLGQSSSSTGFGESSNGAGSAAVAKPIATSMIKKKRKTEDEGESEAPSKKPRTESSNGAANGDKAEAKSEEPKTEEK